jgi:hypothetical protein
LKGRGPRVVDPMLAERQLDQSSEQPPGVSCVAGESRFLFGTDLQ